MLALRAKIVPPVALLLVLGLVGPWPRLVHADTFLLADGRRIEGTAEVQGAYLVISPFAGGEPVKVLAAELKGRTNEPEKNAYMAKRMQLKGEDLAGHFELGLQAERKGWAAEARARYEHVLARDPHHEGAGRKLGYRQVEGRWVPSEAEELRVGPASNEGKGKEAQAEREELHERLKRLKDLSLEGPEYLDQKLLQEARGQPEAFVAILLHPNLKGSAKVKDPALRGKAALLLGEAGNRRAMEGLLLSCISDDDDRVRLLAARALRKLDEPVARRKLIDFAVNSAYPWHPQRLMACIALRRYADKATVEHLLRELSFELAGGVDGDPKNKLRKSPDMLGANSGIGLEPPPPLVGQGEKTLYPVLSALKEVTGKSFDLSEKDFKTWKLWWEKEGPQFKFDER